MTATATDPAGNIEGIPATETANIPNTVVPAAPESYVDNIAPVESATSTEPSTNDTTPGVNIPQPADGTPSLYVDGVKAPATYVGGVLTPTTPLSEGDHELTYTLTKNGAESPQSGPININVDTTGPTGTGGIDQNSLTITDDVAPVTGVLADGSTTNDTQPTYSGTAGTDTKVVNIYDNGTLVGSTAVNADGTWSYQLPVGAEGSTHNLTAQAVDAAGNMGAQVAKAADGADTYIIDTTAPTGTGGIDKNSLTITDDVAPITGVLADGSTTNDTQPTYSGTAGSDTKVVNIYDNGTLVGSTAVNADGTWSYQLPVGAEGSTHNLTAQAVDAAGNMGAQVAKAADGADTYIIDTTAPTGTGGIDQSSLTITDDVAPITGVLADGSTTNDTQPTYSGTAGSDTKVVNIYDNGTLVGSTAVNADGTWSYQLPVGANGSTHNLTAQAVDAAGNMGAQVAKAADGADTYTIDTTAPTGTGGIDQSSLTITDDVAPITGVLADGSTTNDTQPTYSGTAGSDTKVVNIYDNGTLVGSTAVNADGTWSYQLPVGAEGSTHNLTAQAVDAAGNMGAQVAKAADGADSYTIDKTGPTGVGGIDQNSLTITDDVGMVTGVLVDGSVTDDTQPTYSGTAGTDTKVVNIYDNGILMGSTAVNADGTWSYELPAGTDGSTHNLTVQAVDAAGNLGAQVAKAADGADTYIINSSIPNPDITAFNGKPVTTEFSDATPLVSGTVDKSFENGDVLELSVDGGITWVPYATTEGATTWSAQMTDGQQKLCGAATQIQARVVDTIGQVSTVDTETLNTHSASEGIKNLTSGGYQFIEHNTQVASGNDGELYESPAKIIALADGGWAAIWEVDGGLTDGTTRKQLGLRLFNADGTPRTDDIQVSTHATDGYDGYDLEQFDLVQLSNGNIVVGWVSSSIYEVDTPVYRVFNSSGTAITTDYTRVDPNANANGYEGPPKLVALADGGWVAVWENGDAAAAGNGTTRVPMMRVFNADGTARTSSIQVSTIAVCGDQGFDLETFDVIQLANGNIVVGWVSSLTGAVGENTPVYRVFDSSGNALTANYVRVDPSANADGAESAPKLVVLADGGWVAVWENGNAFSDGGTTKTSMMRIFNADGTARTAVVQVSNIAVDGYIGYDMEQLDVVQLSNGNIVVGWVASSTQMVDTPLYRVFDSNGNAITANYTRVDPNANGNSYESPPKIVALKDGGWVAIWENGDAAADGGTTRVLKARAFDANGVAYTANALTISTVPVDGSDGWNAETFNVIQLEDGNLVVTWESDDVTISSTPLYAVLDVGITGACAPGQNIVGTTGADTLTGTVHNDTITAHGGADTIDAGSGNDTIVVTDTSFTSVEGGAGSDVLSFVSNSSLVLDFTNVALQSKVHNIETIDLSKAHNAEVTIDYASILNVSGSDVLTIRGGSDDVVNINHAAVASVDTVINGFTYHTYDLGGTSAADLMVQNDVIVNFIG